MTNQRAEGEPVAPLPATANCATCHGSLEGGYVFECVVCAALRQTRDRREREVEHETSSGLNENDFLAGVEWERARQRAEAAYEESRVEVAAPLPSTSSEIPDRPVTPAEVREYAELVRRAGVPEGKRLSLLRAVYQLGVDDTRAAAMAEAQERIEALEGALRAALDDSDVYDRAALRALLAPK